MREEEIELYSIEYRMLFLMKKVMKHETARAEGRMKEIERLMKIYGYAWNVDLARFVRASNDF